ncbi:MAG: sigma 54-interacting transcriptional regulator [Myxococcaceae bacterium]|nr:sigma 54-interacting transcriptional regulator [Myxococcaceae bacterium]MCI0670868.1 sigma 54-interacting transcriptional regulator [Myxococcaceae bacterium]
MSRTTLSNPAASPPESPPNFSPADIRRLRSALSRPQFGALLGVSPNTVYRWELPPENPHHLTPSPAARRGLARLAEGGVLAPVSRGAAVVAAPTAPHPILWGGSVLERGPLAELYAHVVDSRYAEARRALAALDTRVLSPDAQAEAAALEARCALLGRGDAHCALGALEPWATPERRAQLSSHASALVSLWQGVALGWPDGRHHDPERALAQFLGARAEMARMDERGSVFWAEMGMGLTHWSCGDIREARRHFHEALTCDSEGARTAWRTWREEAAGHVARLDHDFRRAIHEYGRMLPLAATRDDRYARARALAFISTRLLEAGEPALAVLAAGRQAQALHEELGSPMDHILTPMLRGMGEAYVGLGQFDALRALLEPAVERLEAVGYSPYLAREILGRALLREGDTAGARRQLEACRALTGKMERAWGLLLAAKLEALVLLAEGRPEESVAAWERAREAAEPFVSLPLLGWIEAGRSEALVEAGRTADAREALDSAERELAQVRSPWLNSLLARARARVLHAEGRLALARAQMALAVDAFNHAADPWEAQRCQEQLARWPHPEEPQGAAIPSIALERLCNPVRSEPAHVLGELCSVLQELHPGSAVGVYSLAGEHVAGDSSLLLSTRHEVGLFGDRTEPRYRLLMNGREPAAFVRPLLAVVELALKMARDREGTGADHDAQVTELTEEGLVVGSPSMRRVMDAIRRLSTSRATVLVQGESGVGKELVARAVHRVSGRSGRLVSFNCAAVPPSLFEAQLFGHVRGAFTGADRDATGYVRAAHGGTLFLDEVGELPREVQPKLLRFLEAGEVHPVGAERPVQVDVRVVAATHRDLKGLVREGRFREDLYYRINVVPVHVPPLRERPEEIHLLARHILRLLRGPDAPRLSEDALSALTSFSWPGNVRQLRNELERIVALHGGERVITAELLSPAVRGHG